jgi:hypothetical protein
MPLLKAKFFLLLFVRLAEPITSHSIGSHIGEVSLAGWLLTATGRANKNLRVLQLARILSIVSGNKRVVGYYPGMMVRLSSDLPDVCIADRWFPLGVLASCPQCYHCTSMELSL